MICPTNQPTWSLDHCLAFPHPYERCADGKIRCAIPWCRFEPRDQPAPAPIWRCVCGAPMVLGGESCRACAAPLAGGGDGADR